MDRFARILLVSLVVLLTSAPSVQAIGYCYDLCNYNAYCGQSCLDDYDQFTTCEAYGACNPDFDSDGVLWNVDNCPATYNPGQEDCDGDSVGNACDNLNGNFVVVNGSLRKCQIVGRTHVGYVDVRMRYNSELMDTSSCGSSNRCSAFDTTQFTCYLSTVGDCCVTYFGYYDCINYLNNNTCDC